MIRKLTYTLVSLLIIPIIVFGQDVTAIQAGKLVDPASGKTLQNQVILIEGGKIKEIGPKVSVPDSAKIIDLSQSTVLPGLFDCHTHMAMTTIKYYGNDYYIASLLYSNSYRALLSASNARSMLESGFTTIRDVGNDGDYVVTDLRYAIQGGLVPGPTIINSGRIIGPYGGQFFLQQDRRDLAEPEYFFADTRDEMLKAVRENIHFGALVIKIVVDDQQYIYSVEDIEFIVEEARKAGLKVAAHCWTDAGAINAAKAGVASIEHGTNMSEETLKLAKDNGVVLVGTDFTREAAAAYNFPAMHDMMIDRLKRAKKVGITIAFGTDVITKIDEKTRGSASVSFIDSYVEVGYSPGEILKMMTVNAAELLGVDKAKGVLKQGYDADIIATPLNPLDDINALKDVSFVMKGGEVFLDKSK